MDRQLQLQYCRQCKNRRTDYRRGMLCGLTGEKATFKDTCPDFIKDETITERQASVYNQKKETVSVNEIKNRLSEEVLQNYRFQQNMYAGTLAATIAGLAGALIWALITVNTGFQIGYMAVGIGVMVGFGMRLLGKGVDRIYGIAGGIIALLSCVLGNTLSIYASVAHEMEIGYQLAFGILDYSQVPKALVNTFHFVDIIFYGLAIVTGYQLSFRHLSKKDFTQQI